MTTLADLTAVDPGEAASQILGAAPEPGWLDRLMSELSAGRSARELSRVLEVWGLSQAEFAAVMGVSRQAVGKWLANVPAERSVAVADLAAATDVLVHYVRRDRIPAVVRRAAPALGGRSLLDLVSTGDTADVLHAVRAMFDPALIPG